MFTNNSNVPFFYKTPAHKIFKNRGILEQKENCSDVKAGNIINLTKKAFNLLLKYVWIINNNVTFSNLTNYL